MFSSIWPLLQDYGDLKFRERWDLFRMMFYLVRRLITTKKCLRSLLRLFLLHWNVPNEKAQVSWMSSSSTHSGQYSRRWKKVHLAITSTGMRKAGFHRLHDTL